MSVTKETNKPKKLERNYVCSVCNTPYIAKRHSVKKFCSPQCRRSANSQKVAARRIEKIPSSDEWRWLARECKRAGSVQVLEGQTVESLELLFAVRNYRYKTYGWSSDSKTSKYHLCHIAPTNGKDSIGLLHHLNLFVGSALPNQKFGNDSYQGAGLSIQRSSLNPKWSVSEDSTNTAVLAKVSKFLGQVLVDFAKKNPIRMSTRLSLAKWVNANDPKHRHTLSELQLMSTTELRKLRALIEEKEVYEVKLTTKRSLLVYRDELQRLSEQLPESRHQRDIAYLVPFVKTACTLMALDKNEEGFSSHLTVPYLIRWDIVKLKDGMELSKFRDFISFQAFQTLQGAPVNRSLVLNTFRKYLEVGSLKPDWSHVTSSCQAYFKEEYDTFLDQIPVVQDALLATGLVNELQTHSFLEEAKEALADQQWLDAYCADVPVCASEKDYSGMFFEVEEDYVPNPCLRVTQEEIFLFF